MQAPAKRILVLFEDFCNFSKPVFQKKEVKLFVPSQDSFLIVARYQSLKLSTLRTAYND